MRHRTVLADAVADQRSLLRLALARDPAFHVVAEAADGRSAVDAVVGTDADLLLLDPDLPALDGVQVVAAVRDARPGCACIFVSSRPPDEVGRASSAAGAVGAVARHTPASRLAADVRLLAAAVDVATDAAASLHVEADTGAPRLVRRFVSEVLDPVGDGDVIDTVQLLVTELVTNAVVHARTEADVLVRLVPGGVRVEVVDDDDSFPVRRVPHVDRPGGRGLDLVDKMARSWGIDMLEHGKRTWFEVAREP
jgi:CheY-like chemotaxis protein/anti-sigma regulatory factor (Ser/Thr protein kinase)